MKQMMKKVAAGVAISAMMVSAGAVNALAAGSGYGKSCTDTGCGRSGILETYCAGHFVDADNDGVCDHAGSRIYCADPDKDGICRNCSRLYSGDGTGRNFADADGDGLCDHCGTRQEKRCRGRWEK